MNDDGRPQKEAIVHNPFPNLIPRQWGGFPPYWSGFPLVMHRSVQAGSRTMSSHDLGTER